MIRFGCVCLLGASLVALVGCGGSTQAVSGKVTTGGQPVTGGTVTFLPLDAAGGDTAALGEPTSGAIQADGTYKLGVGGAPGAVAGKHRVIYSAPTIELPPGKELKPGEGPPLSPFAGLVPKTSEVEIKSGSNTIDIELVKP
jgi:hypothetical protein